MPGYGLGALELWLDSIRQLWPDYRAQIPQDGTALVIRSGQPFIQQTFVLLPSPLRFPDGIFPPA